MILSRRTRRHISNVSDFCDFDTINETATLHLRFSDVQEIIDSRLSTAKVPVISESAVEMLEEYIEYIPKEFKVNFQIEIEDCGGYDLKNLEASFNKTVKIRDSRDKTGYKQNQSKMGIFVAVGLILLLFVIFNSRFKWFASAGLPLSATIAFCMELLFEVYFEEGLTHFVVTKVYERFGGGDRFGIISIV